MTYPPAPANPPAPAGPPAFAPAPASAPAPAATPGPAPAARPVPVLLDLRDYRDLPGTADGLVELWARLEPSVLTLDPRLGARVVLDFGPAGRAGVWFLDPLGAPAPLTAATPFEIRGVLEPPQIRYACDTCRATGTETYAPFSCPGCGEGSRPGRVCDAHVRFLDGSLRASCPLHVPQCRCAKPARAWCGGPRCRGTRAWCADHLVRHPNDPSLAYCQDCYGERFPTCEQPGCPATALVRCEHRTLEGLGTGESCGNRMCAEHSTRWQIYGPHSRGLALCRQHHGELRSAAPEALVGLVLAGTAARARHPVRPGADGRRRQAFLPRLSVVRHIFINTRGTVLDMGALDTLFAGLERRLPRDGTSGGRRLTETARRLLQQHEASRREDVRRFRAGHEEGRAHFARLVELLRGSGRSELAEAITFSDYRSRSRILYVRVPADLRGRFYGTKRSHVNDLKQRLGIDIQLERE
ncbi:hypothetical protein ABZW03_25530 [Kitasatospora sp. NPDC004799]|uniref:hypothetical protein n=1 Tax=Kitasatospora sp. NPDC004799 TaxID=3154460 RepID=UPI0033A049BB